LWNNRCVGAHSVLVDYASLIGGFSLRGAFLAAGFHAFLLFFIPPCSFKTFSSSR
jgi:hypothetical protein